MLNKTVLYFVAILFFLTASSVYSADEAALKEIYGPRLYGASIDIRYAFHHKTGKSWENSTYSQRKKFLSGYQDLLDKEKIEQELKQRDLAKAQKQEEVAKIEANREKTIKERQKQLADAVAQREKEALKRSQAKKNEDLRYQIERMRDRDKTRHF